ARRARSWWELRAWLIRHTVAAPTVAASAGPGRRSAPGQGGVGRRAATALAAATIGASAPTKRGSAAEMRAPSLRRVVRTPRDRVQAYLQNPWVTALLHPRPPLARRPVAGRPRARM